MISDYKTYKQAVFNVPIIQFNLNVEDLYSRYIHDGINHDLIEGGTSTNSMYNIFDNNIFHKTKLELQDCIDIYSNKLGIKTPIIDEGWINEMQENSIVFPHNHGRSVISGALYLNSPKESANISFISPFISNRNMEYNSDFSTGYNTRAFTFDTIKGTLLLFPSWLVHYTGVNKSKKRVVLSFNSNYNYER